MGITSNSSLHKIYALGACMTPNTLYLIGFIEYPGYMTMLIDKFWFKLSEVLHLI